MKRQLPPEERARFSTNVRHYHRTDSRPRPSWDDWIDGVSAKPTVVSRVRWKVIGIALALLALGGIVAGLIIEMR